VNTTLTPPPDRDLPADRHAALRATVLAEVGRPSRRRLLPFVAAAAVLLLIAGTVAAVHWAGGDERPDTPPARPTDAPAEVTDPLTEMSEEERTRRAEECLLNAPLPDSEPEPARLWAYQDDPDLGSIGIVTTDSADLVCEGPPGGPFNNNSGGELLPNGESTRPLPATPPRVSWTASGTMLAEGTDEPTANYVAGRTSDGIARVEVTMGEEKVEVPVQSRSWFVALLPYRDAPCTAPSDGVATIKLVMRGLDADGRQIVSATEQLPC
jgi:hypothetical protein